MAPCRVCSRLTYPAFFDDPLTHWAEVKPDAEAMSYLGRSFTWGS